MKDIIFLATSLMFSQMVFASSVPISQQEEMCEKYTTPAVAAHKLRSKGYDMAQAYKFMTSASSDSLNEDMPYFAKAFVKRTLDRFAYVSVDFAYNEVPDWISESSVKDKFTDHCKENKPLYFN